MCPVCREQEKVIAFQLLSPRLRISEFCRDDASFIHELLNDQAFLDYIGDRGVRSIEDAQKYLQSGPISSYHKHGYGLWRVELRETGQPIGMAGLLERDALAHCDLGFALLEQFRKLGLAFEAAEKVLQYAQQTLGKETVLATVSPANDDSRKLLLRLGFQFNRVASFSPGSNDVEVFSLERDSQEGTAA